MKKIFILLMLLLVPSVSFSLEAKPTISSVKEGQVVPYNGILLNYEAYAIINAELEYSEKMLKAKCDFEIKKQQEKCELDKTQQKIFCARDRTILEKLNEKCLADNKDLFNLAKNPPKPIVLQDKSNKHWYVLLGVGTGAIIATVSTYFVMKNK